MRLVFIDETENSTHLPGFCAVCAVAWTDHGGGVKQHLDLAAQAVSCCLVRAGEAAGKDLVAVFADSKDQIEPKGLSDAIKKSVESRGYTLVEDVVTVFSSCDWPGVLLADVLAYFGMWTYAGHKLAERNSLCSRAESSPRRMC